VKMTSEIASAPLAADTPEQDCAVPLPAVWAELATRLASVLARMRNDQCLILADKRSSRCVQLTSHGVFGLRVQLPCNAQLPPADRLGAAHRAALAALGWQSLAADEAAETVDASLGGCSDRPFLDHPAASDPDTLAATIAHTLHDALQVPHPGTLRYNAFDSNGTALSWPELGLQRDDRREGAVELAPRLLATLRSEAGLPDLDFDVDGDVCLSYACVPIFVSLEGAPPHVRIRAPLLEGCEPGLALLQRLNEINGCTGRPWLVVRGACVHAVLDLPASPYVPDHVVHALRLFCQSVESTLVQLQSELGLRDDAQEPPLLN
jgi:hypothetical protein